MIAKIPESRADLKEPIVASQVSVASDEQTSGLADLKLLCEKDKLYWPASDLEGHPAEGHNDDNDLLYVTDMWTS